MNKNVILMITVGILILAIGGGVFFLLKKSANTHIPAPAELLVQKDAIPSGLDSGTRETSKIDTNSERPTIVYSKMISTKTMNTANALYVFEKTADAQSFDAQNLIDLVKGAWLADVKWADKNTKVYHATMDGQVISGFFISKENYVWSVTVFGNSINEQTSLLLLESLHKKFITQTGSLSEIEFSQKDYQANLGNKLEQNVFSK